MVLILWIAINFQLHFDSVRLRLDHSRLIIQLFFSLCVCVCVLFLSMYVQCMHSLCMDCVHNECYMCTVASNMCSVKLTTLNYCISNTLMLHFVYFSSSVLHPILLSIIRLAKYCSNTLYFCHFSFSLLLSVSLSLIGIRSAPVWLRIHGLKWTASYNARYREGSFCHSACNQYANGLYVEWTRKLWKN